MQTPLIGSIAPQLRIGSRVYMRHAKAGELCEHFNSLYLVAGERDRRRGRHVPGRRPGVPLSWPGYGPKHPLGVLVGEDAAGVELVADRLEVGEPRVHGRQRRRVLEVALAPMRAAAEGAHDVLDPLEVVAPLHPPVLMDRDVARVLLVGGADQRIVAGDHPELDWEEDVDPALVDHRENLAQCLRAVLARHRVLHLRESHPPLGGEDPVAAVHPLRARQKPACEACEARVEGGKPAAGTRKGVDGEVLQEDVVRPRGEPAAGTRGLVGPVALDAKRGDAGVGEDEELEMVICRRELVEAVEHVLQWARLVHAVQREGGNSAQGHGGDRPQRSDRNPRRAQEIAILGRQLAHLAGGGDQLDRGST